MKTITKIPHNSRYERNRRAIIQRFLNAGRLVHPNAVSYILESGNSSELIEDIIRRLPQDISPITLRHVREIESAPPEVPAKPTDEQIEKFLAHNEQIRKLLALSESDNPYEATAALNKAHVMMKKYGYHKWQEVLDSYPLNIDVTPLIKRMEEVSIENGFLNNSIYQDGLGDGVRRSIEVYLGLKQTPVYDEYEEDYWLNGFVIGNVMSGDFFDGIDIEKQSYNV